MHPATLRAFTDELNQIYGLEKDAGPIVDALKKGTVPIKKGLGMVQKGYGAANQMALKGMVRVQNSHPIANKLVNHAMKMQPEDLGSLGKFF
jgi:hypothetical protein